MWQCSALLVSCVLAVVLAIDTIYDGPREYIERIRRNEASYRRSARKSSVPREVKSVVPNRRVSESFRGTRNTLYPLEASQFQHDVGHTGSGLVVQSSRLDIKVPPSRRYYNPALKKTPYPFEYPVDGPYPFQGTSFAGLYPLEVPTAPGLQLQDDFPTTAAGFSPTALASLPPTSSGNFDFTSPGFVAESWRSFQHIPVTGPSVPIPNFSTRPPWIPRGGKSDFKPQRGNIQTGSAPGNQINTMTKTMPTLTVGNVSALIKMVEQLILASNQNTTNTNTTAIPVFMRFFKHPSVG